MSAAIITLEGVHAHAGATPLLRGISLQVAAGERIALVGHNGAGKSSLLRALSGFQSISQGTLTVLGIPMAPLPRGRALRQLRGRVAQVHQGLHLVGRLSALDNVLIGGAARSSGPATWLRRWPEAERQGALLALERLGMAWAAERRTDALSGGERQKLAMARALHQRAPLLLADEPTASLDADAAESLVQLLRDISTEQAASLICVVHDLELVPKIADRVLALRQGHLVLDAAVTPQTPQLLRSLLK